MAWTARPKQVEIWNSVTGEAEVWTERTKQVEIWDSVTGGSELWTARLKQVETWTVSGSEPEPTPEPTPEPAADNTVGFGWFSAFAPVAASTARDRGQRSRSDAASFATAWLSPPAELGPRDVLVTDEAVTLTTDAAVPLTTDDAAAEVPTEIGIPLYMGGPAATRRQVYYQANVVVLRPILSTAITIPIYGGGPAPRRRQVYYQANVVAPLR